MRIVLAIIGFFLGAILGSTADRAFDCLFGAAVGFLIADLGSLRARLGDLSKNLDHLKNDFPSPHDIGEASAPRESDQPAAAPASPPAGANFAAPARAAEGTPRPPLDRLWEDFEPKAASQTIEATAPQPQASGPSREPPVIAAIRSFFTGGNTLVRVGVIVLFFGVAFLLRYMAEHSHLSIEVRLSGVALASIALTILGWRLRQSRGGYALALQGGGVGILYLVIFAALRLYSILPASMAFPLLALVAMFSAILAIVPELAVICASRRLRRIFGAGARLQR